MPNTFIDKHTARLIGFDYVLAYITPVSPYGLAAKHAMQPFLPGEEASLANLFAQQGGLLNALQADAAPFAALEHQLSQLPDWHASLSRLEAGVVLADVDFLALKQLLYWYSSIKASMQQLPLLSEAGSVALPQSTEFSAITQLLDPDKTGSPSFYLADSYSPRLAALRQDKRQVRQALHSHASQQDQALAAQLNQPQLPTGEFKATKADSNLCRRLNNLPTLTVSRTTYTDVYYRRQPSKQELAWRHQLNDLKAEAQAEEAEVRTRLTSEIRQYSSLLSALLQALGQLDLLLAKVRLAQKWQCVPPSICTRQAGETANISLEEAWHPQVAEELSGRAAVFQPISWQLTSGAAVLTGANMGGKTVALRLVALLTAMAQYGIMVPAESFSLTLLNGIRFLATSYSAAAPGFSRFGSEVKALSRMLSVARQNFMLLYDELASGTNPVEGSALAQAVVEYTAQRASINAFATHYAELTHINGVAHWQVIGLSQADPQQLARAFVSGGTSLANMPKLMDYRLQSVPPGQPLPQEALGVAWLLGLPAHIINRAQELVRK